MRNLYVFPTTGQMKVSLPDIMNEYFKVEQKARAHRRMLMSKARAMRAEGKPCEVISVCVSLARQLGRVERYSTYMGRSAACQYNVKSYDYYWGQYKSYSRS
jgi:hypothetical protein